MLIVWTYSENIVHNFLVLDIYAFKVILCSTRMDSMSNFLTCFLIKKLVDSHQTVLLFDRTLPAIGLQSLHNFCRNPCQQYVVFLETSSNDSPRSADYMIPKTHSGKHYYAGSKPAIVTYPYWLSSKILVIIIRIMVHAYNAHFWSYPDVFPNDYSIAPFYITTH